MTEKATIFIPDISGFTEFVTKTEIEHSAHIINELLDLVIKQNNSGFSLSEIEGDAVLFYKKGEILTKTALVNQCLEIFSAFHKVLKIMERDMVCRCGACQSASMLTLKFIIHYGTIWEFKIANIVKATGIDMIIAHRLLKNTISSNEYILISHPCIEGFPDSSESLGLNWMKHTESYPAIGEIELEYADLREIKSTIPAPPERNNLVEHEAGDTVSIEIDAPIEEVYQKLIDIDMLPEWMIGITGIKRDVGVERIGTKHVCMSPSFEMEVELDFAEFNGDNAIIVNKFSVRNTDFNGIGTDHLKKITDNKTLVTDTSMWNVPENMRREMLDGLQASLELFKALCEGREVRKASLS
jgi:hypothetical protein